MVSGILLDPEKKTFRVVEVDEENWHEGVKGLLGCEYLDHVRRSVRGVQIHVACDDFGVKNHRPVSLIGDDVSSVFGPVLITGITDDGSDVAELTEGEAETVRDCIRDGTIKHVHPYHTDVARFGPWIPMNLELVDALKQILAEDPTTVRLKGPNGSEVMISLEESQDEDPIQYYFTRLTLSNQAFCWYSDGFSLSSEDKHYELVMHDECDNVTGALTFDKIRFKLTYRKAV